MKPTLILFIIFLTLVGAFTLDSFVFHVVYLIAGAFLLGNWWVARSMSLIGFRRKFPTHAFPGEVIPVQLQVSNPGRLPIPWIYLQESLPLEVSNVKVLRQVFSLTSKGTFTHNYNLYPRKRGFYSIGPIQFSSGDLLGLSPDVSRQGPSSSLTVYPKVIPLRKVIIPSHSPMGTIRHHLPIYEDPTRPMGKRAYTPGDSLRRIDWKSTAVSGQLQVKIFEPSITLETVIFLDLNINAYPQKYFYDSSELAIIIAASLAQWITNQKQAVGLIANGKDLLASDEHSHPIPPRKGRTNLILILESLARIQLSQGEMLTTLIRHHRPNLSWGTTQIVVTGSCDQMMLDEFYQSQKCGINVLLILVGEVPGLQELKHKVEILNIPYFAIRDEHDLAIWQR